MQHELTRLSLVGLCQLELWLPCTGSIGDHLLEQRQQRRRWQGGQLIAQPTLDELLPCARAHLRNQGDAGPTRSLGC